jgi:hypothetical protein
VSNGALIAAAIYLKLDVKPYRDEVRRLAMSTSFNLKTSAVKAVKKENEERDSMVRLCRNRQG